MDLKTPLHGKFVCLMYTARHNSKFLVHAGYVHILAPIVLFNLCRRHYKIYNTQYYAFVLSSSEERVLAVHDIERGVL